MYVLTVLALIGSAYSDCDHHARTNMLADRSVIVHLFEWKWTDIADECERFLGPKGFGGVQISPPSENLIIHLSDGSRPWYERYQPMSYKLMTRSGNEEEFKDMTTRCNRVGVRIYADVVINHMSGNSGTNVGTGGSAADFENYSYPAVPYTREHFNAPPCGVEDYNNATQVRNCELVGLKDLNLELPYVRAKIAEYMNHLIHLGVAGFRVDAAKHMWPDSLKLIYNDLKCLNTEFGFCPYTRPYIYQEVIYHSDGAIKPDEYTSLGDVTEFRVGTELKTVFRGKNPMKWLVTWGEHWALSPSETALVFIDNHDTQRQSDVLTYKEAKAYKAAIAFMIAHPYGEPRIMSSYFFNNHDQGPPATKKETIISPSINPDDTCGNGWVCEHRWRQIYQMVSFRSAVRGTNVTHWWDNGDNHVAFSRGNRGFVAFNVAGGDLVQNLQTGLPAGKYCDLVTGKRKGDTCTGNTVAVRADGKAHVTIPSNAEDMHLVIHVGTESSLQIPDPSSDGSPGVHMSKNRPRPSGQFSGSYEESLHMNIPILSQDDCSLTRSTTDIKCRSESQSICEKSSNDDSHICRKSSGSNSDREQTDGSQDHLSDYGSPSHGAQVSNSPPGNQPNYSQNRRPQVQRPPRSSGSPTKGGSFDSIELLDESKDVWSDYGSLSDVQGSNRQNGIIPDKTPTRNSQAQKSSRFDGSKDSGSYEPSDGSQVNWPDYGLLSDDLQGSNREIHKGKPSSTPNRNSQVQKPSRFSEDSGSYESQNGAPRNNLYSELNGSQENDSPNNESQERPQDTESLEKDDPEDSENTPLSGTRERKGFRYFLKKIKDTILGP